MGWLNASHLTVPKGTHHHHQRDWFLFGFLATFTGRTRRHRSTLSLFILSKHLTPASDLEVPQDQTPNRFQPSQPEAQDHEDIGDGDNDDSFASSRSPSPTPPVQLNVSNALKEITIWLWFSTVLDFSLLLGVAPSSMSSSLFRETRISSTLPRPRDIRERFEPLCWVGPQEPLHDLFFPFQLCIKSDISGSLSLSEIPD